DRTIPSLGVRATLLVERTACGLVGWPSPLTESTRRLDPVRSDATTPIRKFLAPSLIALLASSAPPRVRSLPGRRETRSNCSVSGGALSGGRALLPREDETRGQCVPLPAARAIAPPT